MRDWPSLLRTWLLVGSLLLVGGGLLALGTSLLSADDESPITRYFGAEKEGLPAPWERGTPTPLPRPDERSAMSVSDAKAAFNRVPDLAEVVKAAEAGDVEKLIALASGGDYCSRNDFRDYKPPECADGTEAAVYVEGGSFTPALAPLSKVAPALEAVLRAKPVQLEFASRDSRLPDGNGGKYYMVFRAGRAAEIDGNLYDAVGVVVTPGAPRPIQWFIFVIPQGSGLTWIQERIGADGGFYQLLVAPRSVKDWPGLGGGKGD